MKETGHFSFQYFMLMCVRDEYTNMMLNNLYEKHQATFEHSTETAYLATIITLRYNQFCQSKGYKKIDVKSIIQGALLHDIGNLAMIPSGLDDLYDGISLNHTFEKIYKRHTISGYHLAAEHIQNRIVLDIIMHHHEKGDGSGFPDGLQNHEISIYSKIVSLADSIQISLARNRKEFEKQKVEYMRELLRDKIEEGFDEELIHILTNDLDKIIV